jgi:two-component system response regulator AtoC
VQAQDVETEVTLIEEGKSSAGLPRTGFHLLVMSPEAFLTVPLPEQGQLTIGRASDAHIRLDDRMASRRHAVIAVGPEGFSVEDTGSANGTRVRDEPLSPGSRLRIDAGEAIVIGSTVLMVQPNRWSMGTRRLWTHSAFEGRLEDECARAVGSGGQFAVARFRLDRGGEWSRALPVLARELPSPHGLAAYGPNDYEVLFVESTAAEIERLVGQTLAGLRGAGIEVRAALAFFPRDGRSAQALLGHANSLLRPTRGEPSGTDLVAVSDPRMEGVRQLATRAAASTISVLILGETGVGKEVLARSIHRQSARAKAPFLALNCAGLAESLIESELFGYEKGAFTGAGHAKLGLMESANGGTVFLDEIGEMPIGLQARLLRVIESREVLPVGALKPRTIDVRFVAATNRDLEADVLTAQFRRDLFFRLNGLSLTIPPLRERVSEIAELARVFLEAAGRESGRPVPTLSQAALGLLETYRWPGNIRELKNVIERAVVLCDGSTIELSHLPVEKMRPSANVVVATASPDDPADLFASAPLDLPGNRPSYSPEEESERARIMQALRGAAGNQTAAAKLLGIPRRTFVARLDRYAIPRPRKR